MFQRTIIFGNTASGKSWLAQRLAAQVKVPIIALDDIRWTGANFAQKQTVTVAVEQTVEAAAQPSWIIEGVYGWLVTPIIGRATCLIWTDIPWPESLENLKQREDRRGDLGNMADLEPWARAYWTRDSASSHKAHAQLFDNFSQQKFRLTSKQEITEFLDLTS